jgi:hypothetical protein
VSYHSDASAAAGIEDDINGIFVPGSSCVVPYQATMLLQSVNFHLSGLSYSRRESIELRGLTHGHAAVAMSDSVKHVFHRRTSADRPCEHTQRLLRGGGLGGTCSMQ